MGGYVVTICIAVMCENKYVVVSTDKMLTLPLPSIEYETDYDKAVQLAKNCVAATAGSAIAHMPIFRNVSGQLVQRGVSDIETIAEMTRIAYEQIRNTKLTEEILSTYGLNLQSFYQMNQVIQPNLVALIAQRMQEYNYNLWILLAGVDAIGPHIYRVENPAVKNNFDAIGYQAIGSGDIHAISTFIANNYEVKNTTLRRALALAFEAKKRSEKAQGVGEQTNMIVISKDDAFRLSNEALKELDEIYQKRIEQEKKVFAGVEEMISKIDIDKYKLPVTTTT